jgi:REP element-mobilizing transposase RayT
LARQGYERIEHWLDQGFGACLLKRPAQAEVVTSALRHFDDQRYELDCYVVMPNHVHAIIRPLVPDAHPLETILDSWKQYSARTIHRGLGLSGSLWQEESCDRIVRDEEHLWCAIQYIGTNPDRAGVRREECPLWIRPHWVNLGWRFEETG